MIERLIKGIQQQRQIFLEADRKIEESSAALEQIISEVLEEEWKKTPTTYKLHASASINGGIKAAGEWSPEVYVFGVEGTLMFSKDDPDDSIRGDLSHRDMKEFIKRVNSRLPGVSVKLSYLKRKTVQELLKSGVRDENDVITLLGEGSSVLKSGSIWYKGWDGSGIFFIAKDGYGKFRLFLETSGHSSTAKEFTFKNEEDLNHFFCAIEEDDDHASVRSEFFDMIKMALI